MLLNFFFIFFPFNFIHSRVAYTEFLPEAGGLEGGKGGEEEDLRHEVLPVDVDAAPVVGEAGGQEVQPVGLGQVEAEQAQHADDQVLVILVVNEREVQNRIIRTGRRFTDSELQAATNYLNEQCAGRPLEDVREQTSDTKIQLARLQQELSTVKGQYEASQEEAESTIDEGALASTKQRLTEEMRRLQPYYKRAEDDAVAGIPVDSEYIIFIIDTSGSMQRFAWHLVQDKMREVLNAYPAVKGLQVMNDEGVYMFSRYAGKWIPDTKARRAAVLARLRTWNAFSNSSPVEGIEVAIRTYYRQDRRISLYVFGDEFTGSSIDEVVTSSR